MAISQLAQEMAGILCAHWLGDLIKGGLLVWRWPHCGCVAAKVRACRPRWQIEAQPDQLVKKIPAICFFFFSWPGHACTQHADVELKHVTTSNVFPTRCIQICRQLSPGIKRLFNNAHRMKSGWWMKPFENGCPVKWTCNSCHEWLYHLAPTVVQHAHTSILKALECVLSLFLHLGAKRKKKNSRSLKKFIPILSYSFN